MTLSSPRSGDELLSNGIGVAYLQRDRIRDTWLGRFLVQKATKRLFQECCERPGLTLLALETDEDHIHVFVSAPPRFSPALIANLRVWILFTLFA